MAVEFLSDQQAAQYAAFNGAPSRAELERYFFLDDSDLEKVQAKRRSHNRLGFAVQLTSVRYLGRFMPDPRQVPAEVAEYLAEQLGIADPSCLKEYGERDGTARTHAGEIQEVGGWRDFAEARDELSEWLDARAWTTGDGPKSLFDAAAGWLRERRVLLPGASRLARLVGTVRESANNRLWDTLYGLLSTGQRAVLDSLLTVPPGARVSEVQERIQTPGGPAGRSAAGRAPRPSRQAARAAISKAAIATVTRVRTASYAAVASSPRAIVPIHGVLRARRDVVALPQQKQSLSSRPGLGRKAGTVGKQ